MSEERDPKKTNIISGFGSPLRHLGKPGDFYYDKQGHLLYGPKTQAESLWPKKSFSMINLEVPHYRQTRLSRLAEALSPSNAPIMWMIFLSIGWSVYLYLLFDHFR